jgi:phage virion morphogenesis protein
MIEITVDGNRVIGALERLAKGTQHTEPAMRAVAEDMLDAVKKNFLAQGRPAWLGLKRPGKRRAGGMILQDTRQLANSIVTDHGDDFAKVGTNKVYAAIHQFGGMAGRGRKVKIEARPFLKLTADDEQRIEHTVGDYLASLVK